MTLLQREIAQHREKIELYLDTLCGVGIVLLDSELNILDCNQGFMRIFHLQKKPIGSPVADFLILGYNDLKHAEELKLSCSRKSGVNAMLYCHATDTESGHLLFCERLILTESRVIEELGVINNELINLQRESVKKNLLLEKLRRELDERIAEIEAILEALRESEEKFRSLANATWEGIIIHREGIIMDANESASKILGYPVEEIIGKSIIDFLAPESVAPAMQKFREGITHDQLYLEVKILRKNKTIISAEALGRPIRYNNIDARVLAFRDITERKRAEEALRESEYMLRIIVNTVPQSIFWKDKASVYLGCNQVFSKAVGFADPEQIVGKTDFDLPFPKAEAEAYRTDDAKVITSGTPKLHIIEPMQQADGGRLWIDTSKMPLLDAKQEIRGVLGIYENITERKQAEEALRDSEEKYRVLFEGSAQGIMMVDVETVRFAYANPSICRMLGYSEAELLQLGIADIHPKDSLEQVMIEFESFKQGEKTFSSALPCLRKDGVVFYADVAAAHSIIHDRKYVVGFFTDMTERKQVDDALRETNRLLEQATARAQEMTAQAEMANAAKNVFVANISHEIRTPMNAILGFAEVLERDPSLTPRQGEHVRTITRSGAHLLRLINDILDMSKIEAGRVSLDEAVFCVHDFMDDLEMMFLRRANAGGLQFLMKRDESVPRYVTADEGKLRQVLVNIIGNAVKFTVTGGITLRVRAGAVEGKTLEAKDFLRLMFEVEDTGPGIPDEDMGRIFGAFQQAGSGVRAGGTGLGLGISRKLVETMGGELTVTSQVGKGSCFRFSVLMKTAEEVAEREKLVSRRIVGLEPGTGPFRILVVDDMPTVRILLCELLRPVGFEVAEAINGVEALKVFEQWSPHAVIMDIRMPVMDGYEAIQRLKSTKAGRDTSIIATAASALDDSEEQVMALGVDAYLRKPFRSAELFGALGKGLGLRYVFADETDKILDHPKPPPATQETLVALPKEIIQAMRQAVEEGDIANLTELIAQAEKLDSGAARGLQALTDRYDYETLGQWLEKGGTGNE